MVVRNEDYQTPPAHAPSAEREQALIRKPRVLSTTNRDRSRWSGPGILRPDPLGFLADVDVEAATKNKEAELIASVVNRMQRKRK